MAHTVCLVLLVLRLGLCDDTNEQHSVFLNTVPAYHHEHSKLAGKNGIASGEKQSKVSHLHWGKWNVSVVDLDRCKDTPVVDTNTSFPVQQRHPGEDASCDAFVMQPKAVSVL